MLNLNKMIIHLLIIGSLLIVLALVHLIFPYYFNWKEDLKSLSLITKQILQVHTFFIALIVFSIGLLCIFQADEMINTKLGNILSLGLSVFWFIRLIFQLCVYSKKLWRGKRFETNIHIVFTLLWTYFSTVFFLIYYN